MKIKFVVFLVLIAAVALAIWRFSSQPEIGVDEPKDAAPVQNKPQSDQPAVVEEVPNALNGELQNSSDPKRGNLMLLLQDSDRIIYLHTSRDYSALVGKQVQVMIDGSLDDFRLVDIVEQPFDKN